MLRSFQGKVLGSRLLLQRSTASSLSTLSSAGPSTKTSAILTNLHDSVTLNGLQDALKDVTNRKVELQPGCALHFAEQSQAQAVANFFAGKNTGLNALIKDATIPSVEVKNLAATSSAAALLENFSKVQAITAKIINQEGAGKALATIRLKNTGSSVPSLDALFKTELLKNKAFKVSNPVRLNKPALFVRNIRHIDEAKLQKIFEGHNALRIQAIRKSQDGHLEMAIVYFSNEESAVKSLQSLKDITVDGKRLTLAYREVNEPTVLLKGLPANATEKQVRSLLPTMHAETLQLNKVEGGKEALLVFANEQAATIAATALSTKSMGQNQLTATVFDGQDVAVHITADDAAALTEDFILKNAKQDIQAVSFSSGINGQVGFKSLDAARVALSAISLGEVSVGSGSVVANLSVLPSFVVEIDGLGVDKSVSALLEDLKKANIDASPLKTDRNAIVKFRRHMDVVPGLKKLKAVEIEGQTLRAERYRPLNRQFASEYDTVTSEENFDQLSLKTLLKDDLASDPASRYQLARNSFERALNDAVAFGDINHLLDSSLPAKVAQEAKDLLDKRSNKSDPSINQRLFEIFLQREDQVQFSKDFKELAALYGAPDNNDPFNWTQFRMETNDQAAELYMKAKELGDKAVEKQVNAILGEGEVDIGDGIVIKANAASGKDEKHSQESPTMLRDKDGRLWSGVVLNTDMVQKTMPGNRVGTHRALVVVGNMRGSAGYGMGKGKTSGDAINAAFRAALRNLTHIDLYENYGLAHDLHGKHNSCHAYIRATPKSRIMVASPFASSVLLRFGIGSASVKLVGRRDPYSMVMAIFDAVSKHQNIDEYAKARGKRYLTLKWAQDNGL